MHYIARKISSLVRQAARAEDKPITLLFFATGVVITLFQYREYLQTERVEKSYTHVQEWQSGDFKAAFDRVSALIRSSEEDALALIPEDFSPQDRELAQLNIVQARLRDASEGKIGDDLDDLIYFFDKLYVCVDRSLCDSDLLEQFFKDNVPRLWIYSSTFVAKRRDSVDGYGALTERYVNLLTQDTPPSLWERWTR